MAKGLCNTHYLQQHRGEDLVPITPKPRKAKYIEPGSEGACKFPECDRPMAVKREGLCHAHMFQLNKGIELRPVRSRTRPLCDFESCTNEAHSKGLCYAHYRQKERGQELQPIKPKGRQVTRMATADGYIRVWKPEHPNAFKDGWAAEHVVVMSEKLGRSIRKGEQVHHLDSNRQNNEPDNLELWVKSHPSGRRREDAVKDALNTLGLYAEEEGVNIDTPLREILDLYGDEF